MTIKHAVVWIDHHEAKIFHVDPETFGGLHVEAPHSHVGRATMRADKSHPADDKHFFHEVAAALTDVEEILVVGPASAKLELVKYLEHDSRGIAAKIVGIEAIDHPTDGELVAHVKKYFRAVDRMRGTRP